MSQQEFLLVVLPIIVGAVGAAYAELFIRANRSKRR
jgi:hypothetical protein